MEQNQVLRYHVDMTGALQWGMHLYAIAQLRYQVLLSPEVLDAGSAPEVNLQWQMLLAKIRDACTRIGHG